MGVRWQERSGKSSASLHPQRVPRTRLLCVTPHPPPAGRRRDAPSVANSSRPSAGWQEHSEKPSAIRQRIEATDSTGALEFRLDSIHGLMLLLAACRRTATGKRLVQWGGIAVGHVTLRRLVIGALTVAASFVVAVILSALYYDPSNEIRYETPLSAAAVIRALPPDGEAVWRAVAYEEWVLVVCIVTGVGLLFATKRHATSVVRCLVSVLHCAILYWGWVGIPLLPVLLWSGLDGEALAEHLLTYIVGSMWCLWCAYAFYVSWDSRWLREAKAPRRLHRLRAC